MTTRKPLPELLYEAEVTEGLEDIARAEIARIRGISNVQQAKGAVQFEYAGSLKTLSLLNTVIAVYRVLVFDVPRPKALLGHQHLTRLGDAIHEILSQAPRDKFQTLHISAAGAESSVMRRIKHEIADQHTLNVGVDEGDLWLRIRPAKQKQGWEVLIRLTPRPLVTRAWRVQDMPGALNAVVAHALVILSQPSPTDTCLNIGSGSGTILIERLRHTPAQLMIGCDFDADTMTIARRNIAAAQLEAHPHLLISDVRQLALPDQSMSSLLADLPFGQQVGSHEDNRLLYPALLAEAGRVAQIGALFALVTHEIRLIEGILAQSTVWKIKETRMITLRGLHPRIYVLQRR
jgi:tRNA (guanine6-N2)-methyltransferase